MDRKKMKAECCCDTQCGAILIIEDLIDDKISVQIKEETVSQGVDVIVDAKKIMRFLQKEKDENDTTDINTDPDGKA